MSATGGVISSLAVANTLFASILERRREFGIMRAVGTRRGEVVQVVVGEAFSSGVIGGLIGIAAGVGLQWVMVRSSQFINGASADSAMGWVSLGTAAVVALLVAPAVGLLPARMDVVDALRYE